MAPTTLLIPGMAEDHRLWDAVRPLLPTARAVDPRAGATAPAIGAYADAVAAQLGDGAILVGHSLGGFVALEAARRAPGRVLGLVLVACGVPMTVNPRLPALLEDDPAAALALIGSAATGGRRGAPGVGREAVAARTIALMGSFEPALMAAELRDAAAYDPRPWLGELGVPAVCLAGAQDKMIPAAAAAALAHGLGAPLYTIEEAGHQLPWERPDAVADAVSQLSGSGATAPGGRPRVV